jgi:ABC-type amino acid transport substrate-binding protein
MKRKILILTVISSLIALGVIFCFNRTDNEKKFIVGTVADYAPWVSINETGEYEGFDVDVITEIAKKLDKKLVLKDLGSMASLFLALEQGSIDAIIWGLSITKDRLEKIAMIKYQGENVESFPLIFWKNIPKEITSIQDMKNKTICVEPASSQDTVLSRYDFINKKSTEKIDDALLNIQYAKADAAFVEPAIAKKFKKKYPEIQILNVPLNEDDQVLGVGICIKKSNINLIQQIQQAVNDSKDNIKNFEKKWDI